MKQLVLPAGARSGTSVVLTGRELHYLSHVRRVRVGESIQALDQGLRLTLELTRLTPEAMEFRVTAETPVDQAGTRLVLFPFLLKARKLDDVIRQAAEAGVSLIVPVEGDHSVSRLEDEKDSAKKLERWQAIAREAAQQCGSDAVCEVLMPLRSRDLPGFWDSPEPVLFFHQDQPLAKASLHGYLSAVPGTVGVIIGPEGGLSSREVAQFEAAGFKRSWLGSTVLRAETAALYALASVKIILQERSEWTIPT